MRRTINYHLVRWRRIIAGALAKVHGVPREQVRLYSSRRNAFRLLNLRVACLRYHVTPEFVLRVLLRHYRRQSVHGATVTLGVNIPTLCGKRSMEVVAAAVARAYPAGENYKHAKQRVLEKVRSRKKMLVGTFESLDGMVATYCKEAVNQRRVNRTLTEQSLPRPWRGNPFRSRG